MSNTHITVVIDRSGSMETLKKEIIGGFNAFLEDHKAAPGTATLTFVQFDDSIDRLASFKPLAEVEPLTTATYVPRGMTRLYDAIGLAVTSTKEEIEKAAEKPDKVLVIILTDGLENSSQEYTTDKVKALLEARQAEKWEFTFIGANQDAILTAAGIGLHDPSKNMTFASTKGGIISAMASMSTSANLYRCASGDVAYCYSAQQKEDAMDGGSPKQAAQFVAKAVFSEHGSKTGAAGGNARAAAMTPEKRKQVASTAAKARWSARSTPAVH